MKKKENQKNKITEKTSNKRKLEIKEAEFDRLSEYHYRINSVLENKTILKHLINEIHL